MSRFHYSRSRTAARASVLLFASIVSAHGQEKWLRLTSAHFEMFTQYGEKQSLEALAHFEQARSFFLQASVSKSASNVPVTIVAFHGPKDYQPYRLNGGAMAFYLGTESHDFIVMQDLESAHYPVAVHEYTHLIVRHAGLNLPLWLNEGLADLYSTLEPHGDYVIIGRPLAGRVSVLKDEKWLPLPALFAIGTDSPYYNESEKMSIFYSESWLLTDMLMRSPDYSAKFNQFLLAISRGRANGETLTAEAPITKALYGAFGKDLAAISADMRQYFRVNMLGAIAIVTKFPIKLEKSAVKPEVSPAPDLDLHIALIDVLVGEQKMNEATRALVGLASQYQHSPLVDEAWADMAWQQSKIPDMVIHCQNAFRLGSRNPRFLDRCAVAEITRDVPPEDVTPLLNRVLELDPNDTEAHFHLAVLFFNQQKFRDALSQLSQIHSVSDAEASRYYLMQGFSKFKLGSEEEGRKDLETARKLAKTPAEETETRRVLVDLDHKELAGDDPAPDDDDTFKSTPTLQGTFAAQSALKLPHLDGLLTHIDCAGETWQVHVTATSGERIFLVTGSKDVQIREADGEDTFTFVCGENLYRRVSLYYAQSRDPKVAGVAKLLDFAAGQ